MRRAITFLLSAGLAAAQMTIPDGTKLRVRLDQTISSGTAEQGQAAWLVRIRDEQVYLLPASEWLDQRDPAKKKEPEKPRLVVDVFRGDKHVQETFR